MRACVGWPTALPYVRTGTIGSETGLEHWFETSRVERLDWRLPVESCWVRGSRQPTGQKDTIGCGRYSAEMAEMAELVGICLNRRPTYGRVRASFLAAGGGRETTSWSC